MDTIIIGGGQAGLAMAQCLGRRGQEAVIFDASPAIGFSWRERYDSLKLFTPAQYCSLPGMRFPAPDNHYPSKDEVADYLGEYAARFRLDVRLAHRVSRLSHDGTAFIVECGREAFRSSNVVVAAGALQTPWTPAFAKVLDASVVQLHSHQYRRPTDLPLGPVVVVGAGNSGAQIAAELCQDRAVSLSFGKWPRSFPQRWLGQDIFWWLKLSGYLDRPRKPDAVAQETVGAIPLIGTELRRLVRRGDIRRRPFTVDVDGADLIYSDGARENPKTVIWSTGYSQTWDWIDLPGIPQVGEPPHVRGVTPIPGCYFVGLPGLHTKGSGFLGFVGRDTEFLAKQIQKRMAGLHRRTTSKGQLRNV